MTGRRAAIAVVIALGALWAVPHRDLLYPVTLAITLTATAAWMLVVREVLAGRYRPGFREALALAVAARAAVLLLEPALSDDINRYLWEGRMVLSGINPYAHAPSDPALAALRDARWELINNPDIPAAYPPAVQYALAVGAWLVSGGRGGDCLLYTSDAADDL